MNAVLTTPIESDSIRDFALVMQQEEGLRPRRNPLGGGARLELDPDSVKNGLGQLVLTVVKLLHEVLEECKAVQGASGKKLADFTK